MVLRTSQKPGSSGFPKQMSEKVLHCKGREEMHGVSLLHVAALRAAAGRDTHVVDEAMVEGVRPIGVRVCRVDGQGSGSRRVVREARVRQEREELGRVVEIRRAADQGKQDGTEISS